MRRVDQIALIVFLLAVPSKRVMGAGPGIGSADLESRGYRLRGYRFDTVLGQRWAVFEVAAHPDWPLVSEIDPGVGGAPKLVLPESQAGSAIQSVPVIKGAELVVHSGDPVTLWREEGKVRMQLAAICEGSAALGQKVQLRVTGAGIFGSSGWRATGVVRGPGSVEME